MWARGGALRRAERLGLVYLRLRPQPDPTLMLRGFPDEEQGREVERAAAASGPVLGAILRVEYRRRRWLAMPTEARRADLVAVATRALRAHPEIASVRLALGRALLAGGATDRALWVLLPLGLGRPGSPAGRLLEEAIRGLRGSVLHDLIRSLTL